MNDNRECFGKYVNSSSVCYGCSDEASCIKETYDLAEIQKKIDEAGMIKRPGKDKYYLDIAVAASKRSNCIKRNYGCVIVNNDEIIATGYNGSPRGESNCCDVGFCKRMKEPRNSGQYDECKSVHAEQNAIISASRKEMLGATMYLACIQNGIEDTTNDVVPCPVCQRMIINSGIERIINRRGIAWERKS